jgi:hypothetical protein
VPPDDRAGELGERHVGVALAQPEHEVVRIADLDGTAHVTSLDEVDVLHQAMLVRSSV